MTNEEQTTLEQETTDTMTTVTGNIADCRSMAIDEDESAALLGLILLLTQTLSNRQHHRASMALTEWSCVAFHAPFADTQLSIFFHALRCACACMSASCAGYAKTSLLNQIARKAATWMATTKNVLAFKNLPKSYSEQSTTAFKSAGKNGSGEFQTPTTPQQRMLLVQILNRYLHMMGEPFMTLKRTVHRLYQKQKKDNFTMLKKYNATSSNDTCDENKKMDIQMGIFGKLRLAHFVHPIFKIKVLQTEWEDMLQREDHTWVICYHAGIARLHRAMSKSCQPNTRQTGAIKAIAMLKQYQSLRMSDVANMPVEVRNNTYREIWYNMGRAFHYLDISYLALDCYCRALHSSVRAQGGSDEEGNDAEYEENYVNPGSTLELIAATNKNKQAAMDIDEEEEVEVVRSPLLRQTAHNLVLCLRVSPGMEHYARDIMQMYLTF